MKTPRSFSFDVHDYFVRWQQQRLSPREQQRLDHWLGVPENRQRWQELQAIWNTAGYTEVPQGTTVAEQWQQLSQRIRSGGNHATRPVERLAPAPRFKSPWPVLPRVLAFSAAAILLFILTTTGIDFLQHRVQRIHAPYGQLLHAELPDGSRVDLSPGTTLRFPKTFRRDVRSVQVQGEAFFQVTAGKTPFEVQTVNARITVLGTEFNIESWRDFTTVLVVKGKVSLQAGKGQRGEKLILTPGQSGLCKQDKVLRQTAVDTRDILAWRERRLAFSKQPLRDVLFEIERFFSVPVTADSLLLNYTITARFSSEPLQQILQSLSASVGGEVQQTGDGYILKMKVQ